MTRAEVLAKIDTKFHAVADALAATGVDWQTILNFVLTFLMNFLNPPKPPAQKEAFQKGCCPEELKSHLCLVVQSTGAAYASALCMHKCCCPDDDCTDTCQNKP